MNFKIGDKVRSRYPEVSAPYGVVSYVSNPPEEEYFYINLSSVKRYPSEYEIYFSVSDATERYTKLIDEVTELIETCSKIAKDETTNPDLKFKEENLIDIMEILTQVTNLSILIFTKIAKSVSNQSS